MPAENGTRTATAVDIARLQERTDSNKNEIAEVRSWVGDLSQDVKDVKTTQNQSLIVLQKMETSLEHMADRLQSHDKVDEKLVNTVESLQLAHERVSSKFRIVLGILGAIGVAILGVAVKLLFFSPVLSGGG